MTTPNITTTNENDLLASKYQQKTDKAHILDNPDTYIGAVDEVDNQMWILQEQDGKPTIYEKNIAMIPGLYKLFDEGIVNCRDHVVRMQNQPASATNVPVSYIDVSIDEATGTITMTNDGNGIDVAVHPENGLWIPEMIFGHLRTSTNYDKTEKKIVGGKNGFGFKLVLIWSKWGAIETVDHNRGLKYCQTFRQNLDIIETPTITKSGKAKPYTKITFQPDYARLGIPGLSADLVALFKKRVYDITAVTDKTIKVKYNGAPIPVKGFQQYVDMYIGPKDTTPRAFEEAENGRWEYMVALSPSHEFTQVSFVNGIHTAKGGKHVEYILNQIIRKLGDYIEKKKKIKVNGNAIKEQLILFLRCDIENPAFDSQTKDFMNTPSNKFGSTCPVGDKFIEKIAKMGVMDAACALTEIKESKAAKKTDGTKSKNIRGIPKLIDANWAGTDKSGECMVIFCEGDSAKAGIVSGLSSEDRNIIGVYPMKGKILNVRGETVKKIAENKEISEIKKILGLETGKEYADQQDVVKSLRYGRVLFMTDQDLDGSHIKGLCINLFETEWPSLARIPGFIGFMNTPILKARKANKEMLFYNNGEYEQWKNAEETQSSGWKIKYYKGLGTSTGKEFQEYFQHKKIVGFTHEGPSSQNAIDMVFNKKRADDRKDWLEKYDRDLYLDTSQELVKYEEFIHQELIHFSKYDCDRSIPNLMDGLKISLRKILYAAFKKNLTTEIKVAQFTGYVSEHSGYHHGEASLNAAIVGMAQNFVGSNNINLFNPNGQFGTRLQGGKDSASERYIFTQLNKITRLLFPAADDAILRYLDDDGLQVEPTFYAPIVPMILVNGSKGIGTGFSTDIMSYNPLDIVAYLKRKLLGIDPLDTYTQDFVPFVPYYEGFQGTIERLTPEKFLIRGKYEKIGPDKIRITELPVGTWTEDYKEFLEALLEGPSAQSAPGAQKKPSVLKDYDDMSKDTNVSIILTLHKGKLEELENSPGDYPGTTALDKAFKLCATNSLTNMHLFDAHDKLKKYSCVTDIIDDYYTQRLALFQTRKTHQLAAMDKEIVLLSNKSRYIQEILDGTVDLRGKKRDQVVQLLQQKGYQILGDDADYKYLTKMPMDSVAEENVGKLLQEQADRTAEKAHLESQSPEQIWTTELDALAVEYQKYKEDRGKDLNAAAATEKKSKNPVTKMSKATKTK